MKRNFLKTYNSVLVFLMSLLGFAACDTFEPKMMYGTPSADFILKGKVVSPTNTPVAGIEVKSSIEQTTDKGKVEVPRKTTQTLQTTGTYEVSNNEFPIEQTFHLKFTDVDGALNGEYQTLDTTVVFKEPKFEHGDGSWYEGRAEMQVDVKLRLKK